MKTLLVITSLILGITFSTVAQDTPIMAQERATNLSNQMIRDLALNNYQSRKIKEINLDKTTKMLAVEKKYAGNQAKIEELYKAICAERDRELENVLSTVQYNNYFGDRKHYNNLDKEFVANTEKAKDTNSAISTTALTNTKGNTVTFN